jgi:hypothetical protein
MKATPVSDATEAVFQPHTIRRGSVIKYAVLILFAKAGLRVAGFGRTMRWLRHQVDAAPTSIKPPLPLIVAIERQVAMAGALYPGRALCLEQSIVLYYVLRRLGIPAKLRLGVQPHPFLAHTWVELSGLPVNDVAEHVKRFAVLSEPRL